MAASKEQSLRQSDTGAMDSHTWNDCDGRIGHLDNSSPQAQLAPSNCFSKYKYTQTPPRTRNHEYSLQISRMARTGPQLS